jgi:hypothetical protein
VSRERPILFNGAMVRAILDGRKTHTRRIVKGIAIDWLKEFTREYVASPENHLCPCGSPGDRLWVRETWHTDEPDLERARSMHEDLVSLSPIYYRADQANKDPGCIWRPSIHMPRWASRITLEVVEVRVERLQEITEEGAKAEGLIRSSGGFKGSEEHPWYANPITSFWSLWDCIYAGSESWDANPWVWDVEFKVVEP